MSKIKLEDIRAELESNGWSVISDSYASLTTIMEFKCTEGHQVYSTWGKLRNKLECPICKQNELKKDNFNVQPKSKNTFRVLGLDQATKTSGWSIFDNKKLIAYGTFNSTLNEEVARINEIKNWLIGMVENWRPDYIELEGIQYQKEMGVTTFQTLARLQGVIIEWCFEHNIKFEVVHTNTWRNHCGVKGRTRTDKKASMKKLAKDWYDITVTDDEADAIGIGKYGADHHVPNMIIVDWE